MFSKRRLSLLVCFFIFCRMACAAMEQRSSQLKVLDVEIGKTTLDQAQEQFGPSEVKRCSREDGAPKEVCYSSDEGDHNRLILQSGFSGGWSEIDGFEIISGRLPDSCFKSCTATKFVPTNIKTKGGLGLGMTKAATIDLLGPPTRSAANKLAFRWHTKQAMTDDEIKKFDFPVTNPYWDVQTKIDIGLANSKVTSIEVQQIVSY